MKDVKCARQSNYLVQNYINYFFQEENLSVSYAFKKSDITIFKKGRCVEYKTQRFRCL